MIVRKKVNMFDILLLEKTRNAYYENFYNDKTKEKIKRIFDIVNEKIIKLELEDNKEIIDIKYIKVFNYENGTSDEYVINMNNELLSDYFENHDSYYEMKYDNKEVISLIKEIRKESIQYEDQIKNELDIDDEEWFMEIEYKD